MKKHSIAIAFALIGAGIGGFFSAESGSFLPVIYGLCGGCFIGCFVAGLLDAKSTLLQKDFKKLGDLRGLTIEEIVAAVGQYTSQKPVQITDRNNEQGVIYTWTEPKYEISLLFGSDNRCIGVNSETRL